MQRLQLRRSKVTSRLHTLHKRREHLKAQLREAKNKHARWQAELGDLRSAQQAAVVNAAGWHPVAVQRRFSQETALQPTTAAARVAQIQHDLADCAVHVKTLTAQALRTEGDIKEVEQELAVMNAQVDAVQACFPRATLSDVH